MQCSCNHSTFLDQMVHSSPHTKDPTGVRPGDEHQPWLCFYSECPFPSAPACFTEKTREERKRGRKDHLSLPLCKEAVWMSPGSPDPKPGLLKWGLWEVVLVAKPQAQPDWRQLLPMLSSPVLLVWNSGCSSTYMKAWMPLPSSELSFILRDSRPLALTGSIISRTALSYTQLS